MKYQFQVDGRGFGAPLRDTWSEAARDAQSAGYATMVGAFSAKFDGGASVARLSDAEVAALSAPCCDTARLVPASEKHSTIPWNRAFALIGAVAWSWIAARHGMALLGWGNPLPPLIGATAAAIVALLMFRTAFGSWR